MNEWSRLMRREESGRSSKYQPTDSKSLEVERRGLTRKVERVEVSTMDTLERPQAQLRKESKFEYVVLCFLSEIWNVNASD